MQTDIVTGTAAGGGTACFAECLQWAGIDPSLSVPLAIVISGAIAPVIGRFADAARDWLRGRRERAADGR